MRPIVVVSGGFDPVHSGHIAMFDEAAKHGDLIVALNSDAWLSRKKGKPFMPFSERFSVLSALKTVSRVISFDDSDGSAKDALAQIQYLNPGRKVIFANGGDRTKDNIPEMEVKGIEFLFGIGGTHKANSSSSLLKDWKDQRVGRPWGYYQVLNQIEGGKTKLLEVQPGQSLSMQRHTHRDEVWVVESGSGWVEMEDGIHPVSLGIIRKIPKGTWHRLYNPFGEPLRIIEVQLGDICEEQDIERK